MSLRLGKQLSLGGINLAQKTPEEIRLLFKDVLANGMHGICFSAYREGQEPGVILSKEQIRERMAIIAPYTKWVRSFSCTDGNELIPEVAKEFGLKTMVGAWLCGEKEENDTEIAGLIKLTKAGYVDIAAVGNEVMYREEMSEKELITYIKQVKTAVPDTPVGYVDAYYEFTARPNITAACDVILANCYPFWEGCHADYSLVYMKQMFHQAISADTSKRVIITETGWPSQGTNCKAAIPSHENALRYFLNTQQWSAEEDIDIFYFSSFDEAWKVGDEGDVGAYWGIWDKDEKLKF